MPIQAVFSKLTDFGHHHCHYQHPWRVLEPIKGENPGPNGAGYVLTKSNSTYELSDSRQDTSLDHSQRPRADGGRVGVGDILNEEVSLKENE